MTSSPGLRDFSPSCSDVNDDKAKRFADEPELVVMANFTPKN